MCRVRPPIAGDSNADVDPLLERIIFQGDRPLSSKVRSLLNYQKHQA
ncbi:hypothetical protein [Microcoleus vaginatus]